MNVTIARLSRLLVRYWAALSVRERLLLSAFLWVGVIAWGLASLRGWNSTLVAARLAGTELEVQKAMLATQPEIEARMRDASARLDPSHTLGRDALAGRLDELARQLPDTAFSITTPESEPTDIGTLHSVRVVLDRTRLENVVRYEAALRNEAPYLGITRVNLQSTRSDPRLLTATFDVLSIELSASLTP